MCGVKYVRKKHKANQGDYIDVGWLCVTSGFVLRTGLCHVWYKHGASILGRLYSPCWPQLLQIKVCLW